MKKIGLRVNLILFFTFISIQGCKQENTPLFSVEKDVIETPFEYKEDGYISTKVIVGRDTLDFIIDTGSSYSYLPYSNDVKNIDTVVKVLDGAGTLKDVSMFIVKELKWGDLVIKNLSCGINKEGSNYGIIGGDILRNFCVQINNANSKIILSKNVPTMKGDRFITIPFELNNESDIKVLGTLETKISKVSYKKEYSFLFDTGCTREIMFQDEKCLPPVREQQQWKISYNTAFSKEGAISNAEFFLADFRLKDCLFQNVVGERFHKLKNFDLIGTVFIRRFESITIDYKNKMLYFKLPKDGKELKFPNTHIANAPVAHFALLCKTLASLGITFSKTEPWVVEGVREEWKDSIAINDTLVGINNTIFNKNAWTLIKKANNKVLIDSLGFSRDPKLLIPMIIGSQVRFWFLKNKRLVVVNTKRKSSLLPNGFVYSFLEKSEDWGYFYISARRDTLLKYSLHYPWSNLTQKKKEFIGYRNGKEIKVTNEFKFK